jgi:EAL domain-containing protein (putative c-di-GMP-specific phosphodiesterase class I)
MLNFSIRVSCEYICEPIYRVNGQLLGVELLTRFSSNDTSNEQLNSASFIKELSIENKRKLMLNQLHEIGKKSHLFKKHNLLCSINIDFTMAKLLVMDNAIKTVLDKYDFIRLEVSERFPNISNGLKNPLLSELHERYHLWLDDLGAGHANVEALQAGLFELIKIDRNFYWGNTRSMMWPITVEKISELCSQIIIVGIENPLQLNLLSSLGITGVQGYLYKSVALDDINTLL